MFPAIRRNNLCGGRIDGLQTEQHLGCLCEDVREDGFVACFCLRVSSGEMRSIARGFGAPVFSLPGTLQYRQRKTLLSCLVAGNQADSSRFWRSCILSPGHSSAISIERKTLLSSLFPLWMIHPHPDPSISAKPTKGGSPGSLSFRR